MAVESLVQNDQLILWSAVTIMAVVPTVVVMVAGYWQRVRQSELNTQLKSQMLEMGMSAEEIRTVIEAGSDDAD